MPHDHGHFIVGQFELIQDACVESNLAARHAPSVELIAANQIDFPFPFA